MSLKNELISDLRDRGAVIGVIFAVSPDDATTAYALHVEELRAVLGATPNRSTGRCL